MRTVEKEGMTREREESEGTNWKKYKYKELPHYRELFLCLLIFFFVYFRGEIGIPLES